MWKRQGLLMDDHIASSIQSQKFINVFLVKYSSASQEFTHGFGNLV